MRPDTVFTNRETPTSSGLSGSNIGPQKISTPRPATKNEVAQVLNSYFSGDPDMEMFYRMMLHFGEVSKSPKDAKEQFEKIFEVFFISLKKQYPSEDNIEKIEKIQKTIEPIKKSLDNFLKDGKLELDYFKAGISAFLVSLL